MTETQSIVEAYRRAAAENVRAALATVVRLEGSAYRRPGARMLITEDGHTTGVVSGGCLEGSVRERAARVMRTGQPMLVTYDTMTDEDVVWGLGMGCNSIVDVLIEPASEHADHLMRFLSLCQTSHQRAAFATVIQREGVAELTAGTRVFLSPDGVVHAEAADLSSATVQCILKDLETAVRGGASFLAEYRVTRPAERIHRSCRASCIAGDFRCRRRCRSTCHDGETAWMARHDRRYARPR